MREKPGRNKPPNLEKQKRYRQTDGGVKRNLDVEREWLDGRIDNQPIVEIWLICRIQVNRQALALGNDGVCRVERLVGEQPELTLGVFGEPSRDRRASRNYGTTNYPLCAENVAADITFFQSAKRRDRFGAKRSRYGRLPLRISPGLFDLFKPRISQRYLNWLGKKSVDAF